MAHLRIDEVSLNASQYRECRKTHMGSLVPSACRKVLIDKVISSEIMFMQTNQMMKVTPKFKKHVDTYWRPFIRDCLDEIMTLGVVAVDYDVVRDPMDNSALVVPYVIKEGLGKDYDITIGPDRQRLGKKVFRFYRLLDVRTGTPIFPQVDPDVHIFHGFGYDPQPDGRLNSVAVSVLWQERFISRMYYYTLRAEQNRSDGSIFLESSVDEKRSVETTDRYFNGDKTKNNINTQYKLNKAELKVIEEAQQESYEDFMNKMKSNIAGTTLMNAGTIEFDAIGEKMDSAWVPLPHGRKVARIVQPSGLHEWANVNQSYHAYVCAAYQVPRHLIFFEGQRSMNDESGMLRNSFFTTIESWKKATEVILDTVYNNIYAGDDLKHEFTKILKDELDRDRGGRWQPVKYQLSDPQFQIVTSAQSKRTIDTDVTAANLGQSHSALLKKPIDTTGDAHVSYATFFSDLYGAAPDASPEDALWRERAEQLIERVHNRATQSKVNVKYVTIPNITDDELLFKFSMGIVDWAMFKQISRGISNMPLELDDDTSNSSSSNKGGSGGGGKSDEDPWGQDVKLSIMRALKADVLAKAGIAGTVMFPQVTQVDPEKQREAEELAKEKKKNKNNSSDGGGSSKSKKQKTG